MASEPKYSETMSSETTSSAMISGDSAAPARGPVSADAALILDALGRLESAVQDERAVLDRLRMALRDMAQTIAMAKALADSETSAILLDEFEHRVDAMIEMAGGEAKTAEVAPAEPEPAEPEPAQIEPAQIEPAQIEAASAALNIEPEPPSATVAEFVPEAHAEPPVPEAEPTAEHDQVPTVSAVVSRLGPDHDPFNEAVVNALHATQGKDEHAPSVAMLKAMVEALGVASRAMEAPAEPATALAVEEPQPIASATPEPPAEIPEPVVLAKETAPGWSVATHAPDAAPELATASLPVPTADIVTPPPAEVPEPVAEAEEPAPGWPIEMDTPEPPAEPEPAVEMVADEPPAEDVLQLQDIQIETQSVEPAPPAMAIEPPPIATVDLPPATAIDLPPEAAPAPPFLALPSGIHETALLASIERMGNRPFQLPDEGTAVIFTARAEPVPAPPAPVAAVAPLEPAPPPAEPAAPPQPVPPAAAGPTLDAELIAAMADPDFDPTDFLFGPEPEPEPAAFLLDPAPKPKPPEEAKPDDEPPHDPLRALNAMSENEKIALFS